MQTHLPAPNLESSDLSALDESVPLGICLLPSPRLNAARTVTYPTYIHELLQHAGLCYTPIMFDELAAILPRLRILVTVGDAPLAPPLLQQLQQWVEAGGSWLAIGGSCGAAELLGIAPEAPSYGGFGGGTGTLGEGYLHVNGDHPLLAHISLPLHFFEGLPAQATTANVLATLSDVHQRPTERIGVTERTVGKGRCLFIAVDLPGTVVRIQQGVGITRDGVSAPDGSAPVGDSVLKSGDGGVLDWIFDRQPVPDVTGLSAFLEPLADLWRELLLRSIFYMAEAVQVRLPLLWYYPRNLPAVAHLSHDTDNNDPLLAERMLAVVAEAEINSTWCVILPGYEHELIERIHAAGHELAMHYDAMSDECPWSETLFDEQWQALTAMFDHQPPVTNKNHYLRWEGDCELFSWCIAHDIEIDQSKGASKTGEAGFNFGTCHPYYPVDFAGTALNVLEMTTPTQDLIIFAPPVILTPLLAAVVRNHGILHLLFHPSHIAKPGVAESLLAAVAAAKAAGLEWWTAAQINQWERARRQVRWSDYRQEGGSTQVTIHTAVPLTDATILWSGQSDVAGAQSVTRWGVAFEPIVTDLAAGEIATVQIGE